MGEIEGHYVAAYANAAGFIGSDLVTAVAVSYAESAWNTDYLYKAPETELRGLWAINWFDHTDFDRVKLMDPTYNAWAARQVYLKSGFGWNAWDSYGSGRYGDYLPKATDAVAEFESLGGGPGTSPAPPVSSVPPPTDPGLYPNFGPFDPAPLLRQVGNTFHDWAVRLNELTNAIYNLTR